MRDVFGNQPGQPNPPGELKPFEPPKTVGLTNDNGNKINNRFVFQNVGFFDPFYDKKSIDIKTVMEHVNKDIYFRDIHFFIDRITDVSRTKKLFGKISNYIFETQFWNNTFLN